MRGDNNHHENNFIIIIIITYRCHLLRLKSRFLFMNLFILILSFDIGVKNDLIVYLNGQNVLCGALFIFKCASILKWSGLFMII